ncbi:MAG TPA: HEXXH motif domain-containing protein, partial [Thermopolyspora sp.]
MPLSPHRLPPEVLAGLASGGGGEQAVRHLVAAQDSKHRLLVLGVADWARRADHPRARAAERAYDL